MITVVKKGERRRGVERRRVFLTIHFPYRRSGTFHFSSPVGPRRGRRIPCLFKCRVTSFAVFKKLFDFGQESPVARRFRALSVHIKGLIGAID